MIAALRQLVREERPNGLCWITLTVAWSEWMGVTCIHLHIYAKISLAVWS